ncbi:hypothetical protein GCM10010841_32970 [Deinococcus aerophilus]|uniref:GGDEF-domain containing protein n=1 Tax=Deinococcus aerophilus TaxID=522488 RepID=A0ABQ2H020_9DEIO|nr:hypothetical protein GCM10010841_32970 [Deinococcus aerophilus]
MPRGPLDWVHSNLTRLGNHRAFQESFQIACQAAAVSESPLTLARIDVDEFKNINDLYGHLYGDQILSRLGQHLQQQFPGAAFRIGGDEFAVLLNSPPSGAVASLHQLCQRVKHAEPLTLSVGTSSIAAHTQDPTDLHAQADAALYEAKRQGRDRVVHYSEVVNHTPVTPQERNKAVRGILEQQQVDVAFQVIWDIRRDRPFAYEALARFPEASEPLGPQEVFDIAATLGRVPELDRLCWTRALSRAASLPADTLLFINFSPLTLERDELLAPALLTAVEAAGLRAGQVVLEITEQGVGHLTPLLRQMNHLREAGFQLALDDTGAGNSGLGILRQLHIDFIKLDRTLGSRAPDDRAANAAMAAMLAYSGHMGSRVVVEGIETPTMLRHAISLGADLAQGFLLGRPATDFDVPQ